MDELKRTIAFIFNNQGQEALTRKELELEMSITQRWFSGSEAAGLIEIAIREGLLTQGEDGVAPSFDTKGVEIPFDYRPPPRVLGLLLVKDPFMSIVDRMVESTSLDKRAIMARVNKLQNKLNVTIEVAALLVAKELGVDATEMYPLIQERIFELAGKEMEKETRG